MELQTSVSAIVVKDKNFLLLKRTEVDEIGKIGSWTLPCGRIEINEDPNKAVLREVKEETNLNVNIIKPIGIWNKRKGNVWRISICYLCEYKNGKLKLSREHSDSMWLSFKDLNKARLEKWIKDFAKIAIKELNKRRP